jgi:hypothetical protein
MRKCWMLMVHCRHQVRYAIYIQPRRKITVRREDHRVKPHVHPSVCDTTSSCKGTAVTQYLGRSHCNGDSVGLVDCYCRNLNLVICCDMKAKVL